MSHPTMKTRATGRTIRDVRSCCRQGKGARHVAPCAMPDSTLSQIESERARLQVRKIASRFVSYLAMHARETSHDYR